MKDLNMLVWLTQLGLSASLPPAGFSLLGLWLHRSKNWGAWTIWGGLILGLIFGSQGFLDSLRAMDRAIKQEPPPVSYNEHK